MQNLGLDDQRCMSTKQVAEQLGVSRSQVYNLMKSGELQSFKVRGSRRISLLQLRNYIEMNTGYGF